MLNLLNPLLILVGLFIAAVIAQFIFLRSKKFLWDGKPKNKGHTLARRSFIFILVPLVAFYAILFSQGIAEPPSINIARDEPSLSKLQVVDVLVENDVVSVAVSVPDDISSDSEIVNDILETYRWSRKYLRITKIVLLTVDADIRGPNGRAQGYFSIATLALDQKHIDRLLAKAPRTVDQLLEFHQAAAEENGGFMDSARRAYRGLR